MERGYQALTIEMVARRSGVSRPTLYLRWGSKAALVHDAVVGDVQALSMTDTGSLHTDLVQCVDNTVALFESPEVAAALPGLLDEYRTDPSAREAITRRVYRSYLEDFEALVARARGRRETDVALEPDVLQDLIAGAVLMRVMVSGEDLGTLKTRLVQLLERALAPKSEAG